VCGRTQQCVRVRVRVHVHVRVRVRLSLSLSLSLSLPPSPTHTLLQPQSRRRRRHIQRRRRRRHHHRDGTKNEFIGGANMFWFWGDGKGIPSFPACQPAKSSFACQSVTLHYRLSSIADGALRHAYAVSHQLECLRCGSSTLCASTTCNTYGPYTTSLAKTDTTRLKPNSQLGTIPTSVHIM